MGWSRALATYPDTEKLPYVVGFYMCLMIYACKIKGKSGRACFDRVINKSILIDIAGKKASQWLRVFKGMKPAVFFKEYVKATKQMGIKPLFRENAMEELLKLDSSGG